METIPSRRATTDRPRFPWKIFWVLLLASTVGVVSLFPYLLVLFQKTIAAHPLPMPLAALITVQVMQNIILFAGFIALGLVLAPKAGIELPMLQRWLYGRSAPLPKNTARTAALAGGGGRDSSAHLLRHFSSTHSRLAGRHGSSDADLETFSGLFLRRD